MIKSSKCRIYHSWF